MVLAGGGEHDDGDLGVAEHGELARLLHDPRAALGVGHLPVGGVLDPLDLDLAAPHRGWRRRLGTAAARILLLRRRRLLMLAAALHRRSRAADPGRAGGGWVEIEGGGRRRRRRNGEADELSTAQERAGGGNKQEGVGGGAARDGRTRCVRVQFGVERTRCGARRGRRQLPDP